MTYLRMFCIASVTILFMDTIWFSYIAKPMYMKHLGYFIQVTPKGVKLNYISVIAVYLSLILGIIMFVLPRSSGGVTSAFFWGALFGLFVYAISNFTNFTILKNWSLYISLINIAWGAFLCGTTSALTMWLK